MAKGFFAPSWDFFSWSEVKNVMGTSASLAYRTSCAFFNSAWWALLGAVFLAVIAFFQSIERDVVRNLITSLMEVAPNASGVVLMVGVFGVFAFIIGAAVCSMVMFVRMITIMHRLGSNGVERQEVQRSFRQNAFLCLLLPAHYLLAFALLFFIDARPEKRSLRTSFSQAFWMMLRLFPASLLLGIVAAQCFVVPQLVVSIFAVLLNVKFHLTGLLQALTFVPAAVISLSEIFFKMALIHTLYIKTLQKHRELFIKEA